MGWFWYDMDNSPQLPCAMTPAWSAPVPGSCRPWPVPSPGRAPARPCTACSCGGCGGTSSGTAPQSVPVKRGSSGRWRLVSGPWWQKIWIVWPWKINIVKTQVCWDIRGDYRETYLLISGFLTSTRGVGETFFQSEMIILDLDEIPETKADCARCPAWVSTTNGYPPFIGCS